jgi:hypothetical protein
VKKLLSFLIICIFFTNISTIAQSVEIKGKLVDTADNKSLENSVVAVLRSDTTLINFTRAAANGQFQLTIPKDSNSRYLLIVTHPSFADFIDSIVITNDETQDLHTIFMLSKIKLLEEVVVKGNRSVFLRGDTTVFTADSFKVSEGANVEELLKKLPGIQVDRNGKITAMGETVNKVLVDGEEFFGSDPGIAVKNLRADVVKEVEVYDRKSDQATFTGIDDGTRDKTLNLKLKDDKKKGYFGKIEAGGGEMDSKEKNDPRYYGTAMLNAFKGKRKFSAYGISSNTGYMNLDWDDSQKYGSDQTVTVFDDGGIGISMSRERSDGIPTNYNAGFQYNNKFNQDKNSINGSYKFVEIDAPGTTQIFSKNFASETSPWSTNSREDYVNNRQKHNLNFTYETKIDSFNTIKVTTGGNLNFSKNKSVYSVENIDDNTGFFINKNNRNSHGTVDNRAFNANVLWMHKFKKEFRTISINTSFNTSSSENNSFLYSKTDFFKNNIVDSSVIIDQNNIINNNNNNFTARIAYTEPLAKDFYMETSYSFSYNKRNNLRDIFGKSGAGNYDVRIDSLSNDYSFNDMANSPGMSFKFNRKKINASVGTSVGFTHYEQLNSTINHKDGFNFTNYFPKAYFSYRIKPSESFDFYYNGNTTAPSLSQMQPIRNNTDPLNQYIGNPDLRPSFDHSFQFYYNNWKMLKQRSFYISTRGGFTQNAFSTLSYINQAARTTQTVNANGVYYFSGYVWYARLVSKKLNLRVGISPEIRINNFVDFISNNNTPIVKNNTLNHSYTFRISLGMDKEKKYEFHLSPNIGYTISKASVNSLANAKYRTGGGWFSATIYLPKAFELATEIDAEYRQKDSRFSGNNNYTFWDAELRKWLLKKKLQLKFAAKDILNQRNGYSRNFNSSSFTETYDTVLRRYFLLGVSWNFNKQ